MSVKKEKNKFFTRELCFCAFFKIYMNRIIPIKYITQNKEADYNKCVKELWEIIRDKDKLIKNLPYGWYIAITHDVIIKKLKKCGINVISLPIPLTGNIKKLKEEMISDNTKCKVCIQRENCKIKKKFTTPKNKKITERVIIFYNENKNNV